MLHKHGSFERTVYTLSEVFILSIFRFKCKLCKRTTSLLPHFVQAHHQVAWEVKEEVILRQLAGTSLANIAEDLVSSAGTFSEKTLWRWSKGIHQEIKDLTPQLWQTLLERVPHLELPIGSTKPKHEWTWLIRSWQQVRSAVGELSSSCFLSWFHSIKRSLAVEGP